MDLKLIERFLSAMMPPQKEAKQCVNVAFECMRADPVTAVNTIGAMIGHLQQRLYCGDEAIAATTARHVLTGVMIAWVAENPKARKLLIDQYLEHSQRLLGNNVIDFHSRKAGR